MRRRSLCGGKLEHRAIKYPQAHNGKIVILENVPAQVCLRCDEVLLSHDALERMQEAVWSDAAPMRTASVPIYDLAEMS